MRWMRNAAWVLLLGSCASRGDDDGARVRGAAAPPAVAEHATGKVRAPVELELVASGAPDALALALRLRATDDVPRAVARFVLPEGVVVLSGELEQELGALSAGETREASIVVRAPAAQVVLGAGVDCHMQTGVKLYRATRLELGAKVHNPDPNGRDLERDGLRATPARPR